MCLTPIIYKTVLLMICAHYSSQSFVMVTIKLKTKSTSDSVSDFVNSDFIIYIVFFFAWIHCQCKNCHYQFGPGFFEEFIFQLMFLPAVGENPFPHEGVSCSFHYPLCSMELTDVLMDTPGGNNFQALHLYRNVRWFDISANF